MDLDFDLNVVVFDEPSIWQKLRYLSEQYRITKETESGRLPAVLIGDLSKDAVFEQVKEVLARSEAYRPKLLVVSDGNLVCAQRAVQLEANALLPTNASKNQLKVLVRVLAFTYLVRTRWLHMIYREFLFGAHEVYGNEQRLVGTESMLGHIAGHALGIPMGFVVHYNRRSHMISHKGQLGLLFSDDELRDMNKFADSPEGRAYLETLKNKYEGLDQHEELTEEDVPESLFFARLSNWIICAFIPRKKTPYIRMMHQALADYAPPTFSRSLRKMHLLTSGWNDGRREGFAATLDGFVHELHDLSNTAEVMNAPDLHGDIETLKRVLAYRAECAELDKNSEPIVSQSTERIDLYRIFQNGLSHEQYGTLVLEPDNLVLHYEGILFEILTEVMRFFCLWSAKVGYDPHLILTAEKEDALQIVTIRDQQPGLSPATLADWFSPYTQGLPENRLFDMRTQLNFIGGHMYSRTFGEEPGNGIVIYHPTEPIYLDEFQPYHRMRS